MVSFKPPSPNASEYAIVGAELFALHDQAHQPSIHLSLASVRASEEKQKLAEEVAR